jgi:hypothetical protein
MVATAGSISAIDRYEGVLLVVCWPIRVSHVGDLLAYRRAHFVGSLSPGNLAGW